MFELRVLGALQITASGGQDVETLLRQSKRTALLAYLAAAVPRGLHRRDKLLTVFWPESDEPHARAALNQAVYVLRTTLDEKAVVTRGDDDVGLDHDVVWCDVAAFEAALDAGRFAEALALYRGDLLDGFNVTGAPEFERWLDRERARLRQRASEGGWALAEASAAKGDLVEPQRWAKWAFDLVPADEAGARRLMTFLDGLGDRAAALRVYQAFAQKLAQEYELEPSAETQALATAIREAEQHPAAVPVVGALRRPLHSVLVAVERRLPARWFAALAVTILVALGALGLWVRRPLGDPALRGKLPRLVVLPFQNLGSPEDEYFADGITDEITGRLAEISGLLVISRTSAVQYKHTGKTTREIGQELSVGYVLEGTIRRDPSPAGTGEVRVTPRLIRVADESHLWSERYTATLIPGEIFSVQADIAERVAEALNVTLREPERRSLAARPTEDPHAYDYYLRGNEYYRRSYNEGDTRIAVQMYERAVASDSGLALGYARLGEAHGRLYWLFYDRSTQRLAQAKRAVDRAVELDPDLPQAHVALGYYHYWGYLAYDQALAEFRAAQQFQPHNSELFEAIGSVRRRQGAFQEALAEFGSAFVRDPRSPIITFNLAQTFVLIGDAGQAEHYLDRTISLAPEFAAAHWQKARLLLRVEGSTPKARAVLESPQAPSADPIVRYHLVLVDLFDRKYQAALRRLGSEAAQEFDNQGYLVPTSQLRGQIFALMNRPDLSRSHYDSARAVAERRVRAQPAEPNFHSALGIAYAGLGRTAEAISEALRAVDLLPVTKEAWRALYRIEDLARVYVMAGEYEAALEQLERLISLPGGKSISFLILDPVWNPLRDRTRFRALLRKAAH